MFIQVMRLSRSTIVAELESKISLLASSKSETLRILKGKKDPISSLTPEILLSGMRGAPALVTETSRVDPVDGITYRGYNLRKLNEILPRANGGSVALPEAALYLLLTGDLPTGESVSLLTEELHSRSELPINTLKILDSLPITMHPMTQLIIGILSLRSESEFTRKYNEGQTPVRGLWKYTLSDSISLIAKMPVLAAMIYRRTFKGGEIKSSRKDLDWAGNYAHLLGVSSDNNFKEAIRLYLTLHADHEGGNVSSHASTLVGSALADPYLAVAAGLCGLAGPLHGLANQEALKWLLDLQGFITKAGIRRDHISKKIEEFAISTLERGRVIPGYGHAVLRGVDPRFTLQKNFANSVTRLRDDDLVNLVSLCSTIIPRVLQSKAKNPHPNVDSHSGVILYHYGLREADYYTVVFAVSRALGLCSQLIWARALNLPIERPKSVTLDHLSSICGLDTGLQPEISKM